MELFRKSAGYRFLDAFVLANVVELGTGHFCERFLNLQNDPGGRTCGQMTHAARSGCRNFAEGSERLMTSYSTALELLDVARASLCELRDDFNKWLNDNKPFWGCTGYPACRGVVDYEKNRQQSVAAGSDRHLSK